MPRARRGAVGVGRGLGRGFTYVLLLASVAVAAALLAAIGPRWADEAQRERERDLLRIGELYARAIASYHEAAPGSEKRYPRHLADLLWDTRFVAAKRHLRQLYPDPLQPDRPWGLVPAGDGGIAGVFSLDERPPWRRTAVLTQHVELGAATRYSDWKFVPRER